MRSSRGVRFAVVVAAVFLAAALVGGAPGSASAQFAEDSYVSCIKCHALPGQQALGQLGDHGTGYPPAPEQACAQCHDTFFHEQNPGAPPPQRYFWSGPSYGPDSYLTNLCTSCHPGLHSHELNPVPTLEGMPYFDGTPGAMLAVPTSVLPLFDPLGQANQDPAVGGMVCSTCHDPHEPAFPYGANYQPKFLRIGSPGYITTLCSACHDPGTPSGAAADLVIPSRTSSVSFQSAPYGQQQILVTVKNRGNARSYNENAGVLWVDAGGSPLPIGSFPVPPLEPEQEWSVPFTWTPPAQWSAGEGHYLFSLPPSPLLQGTQKEYVRAMYLPPAPTNLRVMSIGAGMVSLTWDPPPTGPSTFDVYRDGLLLARSFSPYYYDSSIAPETPHVYTVKSVTPQELSSEPGNAVGATTTAALVVRVPQDFPTIQEAIWAAQPGTSIHVSAGTYTEPFSFYGKEGITVRGQDAAGCVLDLPYGDLDLVQAPPPPYSYGLPGNTIAGFTIRGNTQIRLSPGDVLANCVVGNDSGARVVAAGGLAANCVFDGWGPPVEIVNGGFFAAVNSIFFASQPLYHTGPPATAALLLNNDFLSWFPYEDYQGTGNFSVYPVFQAPGPPATYFTLPYSPTTDAGLWLGAPYSGGPDVGVFEAGLLYTPKPPANLSATAQGVPAITLAWTASPDFTLGTTNYYVYRATVPSFPPGSEQGPYATIPAGGMTTYTDYAVTPGVTYHYQVRASNGPAPTPWQGELLSTPTNTASAQVTLNRPPAPAVDAAQTPEDQAATIAVLANDTDPDGDPLFLASVDAPQHGTASVNPDGTVRYAPAADYSGADQFLYTVTDGRGEFVNGLVTVDVTPVNDPPVAADDAYTTTEDAPLFVPPRGLLLNDFDPDGDPLYAQPGMTFPAHGVFMIYPDGSFQYVPDPDFNGTDSFTYAAGSLLWVSNPATVTIHVTAVNDLPVANPQPVWTEEDTAVPVVLSGADAEGDPLTFAVATPPAHGNLTGTAPSLTYVPHSNYHGPDSFTFTTHDGQLTSTPATVAITVEPVNDPPVATDRTVSTDEDTAVALTLAATDVEGDALNYAVATGPAHGTLSGVAPNLAYTPDADFNGADSFTFTASDPSAASAPATVTLNVRAVNDPPVAVGDDYTAFEDTTLDVPAPGLLGNDTDVDGPSLAPVLKTGAAHGAVTLNPDRSFRYRAYANYSGPDSFVYHANDGLVSSDDVTVTITVVPVPDAPVASPQSKSTAEDSPIALTLTATDADGDALAYAVAQAPLHGTLSGTAPNLTYTPDLNYYGSDSFTFTATDGQLTSPPATVSISVAAVNDPPVANSVNETTREDESWGLAFTATDVDPYAVLTYAVVQGPAHGTLTGSMPAIRYVPAPDFHGTDSVTFTASDGQAVSNVATITITVTPVNDRPVAANDAYGTLEDTALTIPAPGVLDNDTDVDGPVLTTQLASGTAHGTLTLNADGSFTYVPAANYSGPDAFSYYASDGQNISTTTTVAITVSAVNDAPVANAGPDQGGTAGVALTFSGSGTDPDGTITGHSWSWGDGTPATAGASAAHTYAAAGVYTVTLTVTDDGAATATDTLVVTVVAAPPANLALNKAATASSAYSASYAPAKAVDGSAGSYWKSKSGGSQWLKVDLGASTAITKVKVSWLAAYYARSFKVETSTNGSTWTSRYSTSSGTGGVTSVSFPAASARYVRVSCTKGVSSHYGVAELEVYK